EGAARRCGRRGRGDAEGQPAGAGRYRVQHRPVAAARARGGGRGDGAPAGLARAAGAGVPVARPGAGADRLAGGTPGVQAGHRRLVARRHPRRRSRCRRRGHRRDLRRDGLAGRPAGGDRKTVGRTASGPSVNSGRMALFDLTSSWVTGRCCELAARGYSRDGKKGCEQIEYGILTDPAGRPVAVRVFPGNTADPDVFTDIIPVIRDTFALENLVLVGDRGMITAARIEALRKLNDNPDTATDFGWITALRAPAIATLAADDGPLQMSLFDAQALAEISHPDSPGERLIACRNPALAAERARKRSELLAATDKLLAGVADRVARGTLAGAAKIGISVGKAIGKYKMGKHFHITITDTTFTYHRDTAGIDA